MQTGKLLGGLVAATLLLTVPVCGAARPVATQVDGTLLSAVSYLQEGVTYAPLRALLDRLGDWTVVWADGAAVATDGKRRLVARVGADSLTVDGAKRSCPPIFLRDGRTYVPLRAVTEAVGAQVAWDGYLDGAAVTTADFAAANGCSASDFYWMARIISAESQGEPLEGQIAVGNVVENRVASQDFPATIPAVIFERTERVQFEPVANGRVFDPPVALSIEAAKRVLAGEETVSDCLYFYAPALSPGTWINENRSYEKTIGCHRFYR
ncbi:MAG: cell wall hydrolase [Oscillospiraceae bacterium]